MNKLLLPITICSLLFLNACSPKPLADIDIPLTGQSVMGGVEGDPYRYFRYESAEAAQADVDKISDDGRTIDGKRMQWQGPVHVYYLSKRIVIYVGDNENTMKVIQDVFGPQVKGE